MPMKKTFTTLFLSVLMSAPLSAQDIVSSETENTIRDLFSASLQGATDVPFLSSDGMILCLTNEQLIYRACP